MDNKYLYALIAILIVIFIVSTVFLILNIFGEPSDTDLDSVTKMIIENPIFTAGSGDVLVAENDEYRISYLAGPDSFIISILDTPFGDIRENAEQDFLLRVGGDTEIACALTVTISTPIWVDENLAGQSFGLTFCNNESQ